MLRAMLLALASFSCLACAAQDAGNPVIDHDVGVRLVVPAISAAEEGPDEAHVHHVEVQSPAGTDTVPDVLAGESPRVMQDGRVTGIAYIDGVPAEGFLYDPPTRTLSRVPLAEPMLGYSLAPDGRHIGYTTMRDGQVAAIVRSWPGGDIVFSGPPANGYPSGVAYDFVEWLDSATVRINQRLDHFAMRAPGDYRTHVYQRTTGSVLRPARLQVDTVTVQEGEQAGG